MNSMMAAPAQVGFVFENKDRIVHTAGQLRTQTGQSCINHHHQSHLLLSKAASGRARTYVAASGKARCTG